MSNDLSVKGLVACCRMFSEAILSRSVHVSHDVLGC